VKISAIRDVLDASILAGKDQLDTEVDHVYASDLMSDVLAFGKTNSVLLTGLATRQALVSAHMAEFKGVVLIRGKKPSDGSAEFAESSQLVLLSTELDMYDTCVRIETLETGLPAKTSQRAASASTEDTLLHHQFRIEGSDFTNAGVVSTELKSLLKTIGFDPRLIRRIAICTFEGEMNVVMHARCGTITLAVTPVAIDVVIEDEGKGIPDVEQAMQEGFSTATEEMRARGFGSGMGLPNIRRNSDELNVTSVVGKGTTLSMKFLIRNSEQSPEPIE
jgi:serine/threonine-protein kinase RsbT